MWLALYWFLGTRAWVTTYCKGLVYQILWKSDAQLNRRLLEGHHLCISVKVMEFTFIKRKFVRAAQISDNYTFNKIYNKHFLIASVYILPRE